MNKELGNLNNYEGPTHIFTKNDRKAEDINMLLFSIPFGTNYTIMLIGI